MCVPGDSWPSLAIMYGKESSDELLCNTSSSACWYSCWNGFSQSNSAQILSIMNGGNRWYVLLFFKNEWYISNEKHMLLSSFSCHFWDGNQLPDPFFPSTCWITSYFNNPKMKTMNYYVMENWANINSGVRGSCSFSAWWELHLSGQGWNSGLQHKYPSAFPKGPWDREVLQNFLPEFSRSLYNVTARGLLVT